MLTYYRNGRRSGRVELGQVVYLQDGVRPMGVDRYFRAVWIDPYIVESFATRCIGAAAKVDGRYVDRFAGSGHLVNLRSLRTSRRVTVADWLVEASAELAA